MTRTEGRGFHGWVHWLIIIPSFQAEFPETEHTRRTPRLLLVLQGFLSEEEEEDEEHDGRDPGRV